MSSRWSTAAWGVVLAGVWVDIVLFDTPLGEKICRRLDRLLSAWLTGVEGTSTQLRTVEPSPAQLRDFWDWADTHRLVIGGGGRYATEVHIIGLRPHSIGQPIVEIARGVTLVADAVPDEFGLYPCPRCTDCVVDLRAHLKWCRG